MTESTTVKKVKKSPYGDVPYADPGFQSDGKKRYPIDSADHVRAAWNYINVGSNAARYSPTELAHIKARILQAAKKFGVDVQSERSQWLAELSAKYLIPTRKTEELLDLAAQIVSDANASMLAVDDEEAAIKQKPNAGYDAESGVIRKNKKHPNAKKMHPFRAGQYLQPNGSPRCLQCGGSQPAGGMCTPDVDGDQTPPTVGKPGSQVVPVQASVETPEDAAKTMQGIDAGVDQALVLLRSTPDLPEYAAQARDLLHAVEEACDGMLAYFGVPDADDPSTDSQHDDNQERAYTTTRELRVPEVRLPRPDWLPAGHEFITELNGRTIITAQASAVLEQAMTPHDHYLWTQGRLVGADAPNRNGAQWSSSGLETGQSTVPFGPLNWLHEDRHIIGTIAAAHYVQAPESAADGGVAQNHIAIAAPVWRWLYPDESAVIEMASDSGRFWYSMECISRTVSCIGDGGCGTEVSYLDYMKGENGACEHMVQRSAVRQFVDPIFLGAAVIVPPVRPGWADADATVARQAASLAEMAYDNAGRPDMSASEWEQLMCQVVRFATT